ncbi:MAG: hypothetical protein F6K47_00100 [Symploca sp. SIO2E6]|nr:hypothetical protein [Symploca sp. SIO2E6]
MLRYCKSLGLNWIWYCQVLDLVFAMHFPRINLIALATIVGVNWGFILLSPVLAQTPDTTPTPIEQPLPQETQELLSEEQFNQLNDVEKIAYLERLWQNAQQKGDRELDRFVKLYRFGRLNTALRTLTKDNFSCELTFFKITLFSLLLQSNC